MLPMELAEYTAALAMLAPFLVGLWFYTRPNSHLATKIASVGCMLHAPFSMALHFYRAAGTDAEFRTMLYKLDVAFMHVNLLLVGFAWSMRLQLHQLFYNSVSLLHLVDAKPLVHPPVKNRIDMIVALCFLETSFGMLFRAWKQWASTIVVAVIAFFLHHKKVIGLYSSALMHLMMAIPHYITMWCIQQNISPTWGYM